MATWVRADGKELILDPTYGTVLPFDIEHAEAHLDQVRQLYYETSASGSPIRRAGRAAWTASSLPTPPTTSAPAQVCATRPVAARWRSSADFYVLKWLLPLVLLAGQRMAVAAKASGSPALRGD